MGPRPNAPISGREVAKQAALWHEGEEQPRGRGETGRRKGLKIPRLRSYGFDSRRPHHWFFMTAISGAAAWRAQASSFVTAEEQHGHSPVRAEVSAYILCSGGPYPFPRHFDDRQHADRYLP